MGLLVALIGLTSTDLVVSNPQTLVQLGDMDNYNVYFVLFGICFIGTLMYREIPGGILLGIVILSTLSWIITDSYPEAIVRLMSIPLSPFVFEV